MTIRAPSGEPVFECRNDEDWEVVHEVWAENVYLLDPEQVRDRFVLDIGAHIGAFSLLAASHGANVIAFEPDPENAEQMRRNLSLAPGGMGRRVTLVEAAVGSDRLRQNGARSYTTSESRRGVEVERADLNGVIGPILINHGLAFLKVDCEGCEWDALAELGERGWLVQADRISGEWHGPATTKRDQEDGETPGALIDRLLPTHNLSIFGRPDEGGMFHAYSLNPRGGDE